MIPLRQSTAKTIRIGPAFSIASEKIEFMESILFFLIKRKARNTPMARAKTGSPGKRKTFASNVAPSLSNRLIRDFMVMSSKGTTIGIKESKGDGRSFLSGIFSPSVTIAGG